MTYDGPIVVLVDVLSGSWAEEFAGGLQAIGRAAVIGEQSLRPSHVRQTLLRR